MNYKLFFPTYANRFYFVKEQLDKYSGGSNIWTSALNIGTGEGDYDPMIKNRVNLLLGVDINEEDLVYAAQLNRNIPGISYKKEDALNLSFPENSFDLIVSVDVIEHVGAPEKMLSEIARVLKPGGFVFITFPQIHYPFTYDPVNKFLEWISTHKIPEGAYAFGHTELLDPEKFKKWTVASGLQVVREKNLSGYLAALVEMYWTGWVQRIFKANAKNSTVNESNNRTLRPGSNIPVLSICTRWFCKLDYWLFKNSKYAVGKGFVLVKK